MVDLFIWFMGGVSSVIGLVETKGRTVEVETMAMGLVSFKNGSKGSIEGSTIAYPGLPRYIELIGSRGTLAFGEAKLIRLDLIDPTPAEIAWKEATLARQAREAEEEAKKPPVAPGTAVASLDMGHVPVFADFVAAIQDNREPFVNGEEARRSVELITAIYESSAKDGQSVKL
jgi:predicted dehydrogenase